ncbi:hypothetical protein FHW13_002578 [Dokdonella fugitiva]|nr:hypothetical protein [Dokdonella fugitiva]
MHEAPVRRGFAFRAFADGMVHRARYKRARYNRPHAAHVRGLELPLAARPHPRADAAHRRDGRERLRQVESLSRTAPARAGHARALVDAIEDVSGTPPIELVRDYGETRVGGQGLLDAPAWT